ncbi:MAG: TetR/AcrR family transcriptional regulator, cholesterol catabolism regulator [Mycobacterium sp.]|nr:TetR/AcrR family transcriptional regulator, cholesterol catabolism regulator [Mycobacterium sp.]
MASVASTKDVSRAERDRRRDLILDSAVAIATDGGYDEVKMRTVADDAGIAVGTLYRYFPTKAHVLVAVLAREFQRLGAERDWTTAANCPRLRLGQLNARLCEEWRARPALTEAVTRAFVFADTSAEVDHAAAVIEDLLGLAIAGGEPSPRQHRLASVIVDIWVASLIAWVRGSTSAEDIAVRLERSVEMVLGDEK